MSLACAQCSRINPAEAAYCYYDGAALSGRGGGPINAGAALFSNPFVFPNGLSCRNFDQLASACQQNWSASIDLLRQGFLGSFFGGIGRVDLAMAAKEAAAFPDLERGLDQLIAKLPTQAVQAPKLQAEPSEVNLGVITIGEDRSTEIHLTNLGMRLCYGSATSDSKWLLLGDAPGHPEKIFQFGAESIVPVQIRGQHLRAGTKPLEGHITLDSNGGTVTITFKADVPITPFPDGLFAGAVTPRQVAEKAKATPKDAAPYFEKGDIARWYAANGWAYPVIGPTMPGMGGIQQFFEALGVAKAPTVDFTPKSLNLEGAVGKTVEASIEVTEIVTGKRKVVYGWATCEEPWVEIGHSKLTNKNAIVPITIRIPDPCPPTLEARIHAVGNGNQKLDIPVKIKVAGGKAGVKLERAHEYESLEIVEDSAPLPVSFVDEPTPASIPRMELPPPVAVVAPPPATPAPAAPAPSATEPMYSAEIVDDNEFAIPDATKATAQAMASAASIPRPAHGLPMPVRLGMHLIPVAFLGLCLLVLVVVDIFSSPSAPRGSGGAVDPIDERKFVKLQFDEGLLDRDYSDSMMFAVHKLDPDNPSVGGTKLNWYPNGAGNSVVVKIDNGEAVFGQIPGAGKWMRDFEKSGKPAGKHEGGRMRAFEFTKEGIQVTQTVTIEPSDPIEIAKDDYRRLLAMCLVKYRIHNTDKRPHRVGLRVLMDTCIGDKDDVPFLLPGVDQPVTDKKKLEGPEVPSFVQVIERTTLRDPGIVLQMNLRLSDKLDAPDRFLLTHYPGKEGNLYRKWDVPYRDIGTDSCAVIYWDPRELGPGKTRDVGFTYGLGSITAQANNLGLTVGGSFQVGGELTVVALVSDRNAKSVTIELPPGMSLLDAKLKTQNVPPMRADRAAPVTWKVRAGSAGPRQEISVKTDSGAEQKRRVTISDRSLFN